MKIIFYPDSRVMYFLLVGVGYVGRDSHWVTALSGLSCTSFHPVLVSVDHPFLLHPSCSVSLLSWVPILVPVMLQHYIRTCAFYHNTIQLAKSTSSATLKICFRIFLVEKFMMTWHWQIYRTDKFVDCEEKFYEAGISTCCIRLTRIVKFEFLTERKELE